MTVREDMVNGRGICHGGALLSLAKGVVTWANSAIMFQASMDILLTFMFLWNMVGALILMPALVHFLSQPEEQVESGL